tara:strand:- start:549 stop:728 length:180 start_codon:yes stop_codon:yes gene_type:complete
MIELQEQYKQCQIKLDEVNKKINEALSINDFTEANKLAKSRGALCIELVNIRIQIQGLE